MAVKGTLIHAMKEMGLIKTIWISGTDNESDLFTKNLSGPEFDKHASKFCGSDDYYKNLQDGESVRS